MKHENVDFSLFSWMNPPDDIEIGGKSIEFMTMPDTDFWQRTYCGSGRNNGHAFLTHLWADFSMTVVTEFYFENSLDQIGVLIYIDENNWAKASLAYQDEAFGLLGSVVTNGGYSDWAGMPYPLDLSGRLHYRVSRRSGDFLFEQSPDGRTWQQMRVFHMMGDLTIAKVGIYACSPGPSSFKARFSNITVGPSGWA